MEHKFIYRLLILIGLLSLTTNTHAQGSSESKWEMVGFINFSAIARQSPSTIMATTRHGYLYTSHNNGLSWDRQELNDTLSLTAISFLDSLHVVVTDDANHVIFSSDGGMTWRYSFLSIPFAGCMSVAYVSTDTVFVCDRVGHIWRTTDAGTSAWKMQTLTQGKSLNKLFFLNSQIGFVAGDSNSVFMTSDAGEHWVTQNIGQGDTTDFFSIDFINAKRGIIVGNGFYYTTSNSGLDWKKHKMPNAIKAPLYTVKIVNDSMFFAFGYSGQLYSSSDFGETLNATLLDSIAAADYTRSVIYDADHGAIAVGDRGLIMRSKQGRYWIPANQCPSVNPIESLGNGILHSGTEFLVRSEDGGVFWNGYYRQNETNYIGLHFTSPDSGFLINQYNADWLRTSNNGKTWTAPTFSFPLPAVDRGGFISYSFSGKNVGYVSGDSIIVGTLDNGNSWKTTSFQYDRTTPFVGLSKPKYWNITVQAVNNTVAFAVLNITDSIFHPFGGQSKLGNYHSQLLRTTDAGTSWAIVPNAPVLPRTMNMAFPSEQTGYLACDSNILYKTTDAGSSWSKTRYSTANHNYVYGLRFLNDSVGFISYRYDGVFSTKNGGNSWNKENIHHPSSYPDPIVVNDFVFPDSNSVIGIGTGSQIGLFRKTLNLNKENVHVEVNGNPIQYLYIQVYPNPAKDLFHCQLDGMYVDPSGNISAGLYDILGRQVMDLSYIARINNNGNISRFTVDATLLSSGIYTIQYKIAGVAFARQIAILH